MRVIQEQIRCSAGRLKAANDVKWCDYYPLVTAAARSRNLDVVMLLQKNFLQTMDELPTVEVIRSTKMPEMSAVWKIVLANIHVLRKVRARGGSFLFVDTS